MSKIEHDLALSSSIMQAIQELIKPPDEDPKSNPKTVTKHPYYKRQGRVHNHDSCDACDEGGDLICCDKCPSSFHLQCHDPPLNEEDIPNGQWLCHNCRMTTIKTAPSNSKSNSVDRTISTKIDSTDNSRPGTPNFVATLNEQNQDTSLVQNKIRNLRKRSSSHISNSHDMHSNTNVTLEKTQKNLLKSLDSNKKTNPLDELINAAMLMNPKQFGIPRELELHYQFPGSDKVEPIKNGSKKPCRRNSKPYELDSQGLVPLPAKTCFYCRKSCRKAPLVACDYCPLLFHLDCLDPPLAALPTCLWMCPNHPENFIDLKLLNSISTTERVKLWNKFSGPVDHETVKTEFFRRVHMKNPPFRFKLIPKPRDRVEIPPIVQYYYENPPPMLPTLRDAFRYEMVNKRYNGCTEITTPTTNEIQALLQENISAIKSANDKVREFRKELGDSDITDEEEETEEEVTSTEKELVENASPIENEIERADTTKKIKRKGKRGIENELFKKQQERLMKRAASLEEKLSGKQKNENGDLIEDEEQESDSDENENKVKRKIDTEPYIDAELKYLDVDLIKVLAFQRLQQIIVDYPDLVVQYRNRTAAKRIREILSKPKSTIVGDSSNKKTLLPSQLLSHDDITRISKMFTVDEQNKSLGISNPTVTTTNNNNIVTTNNNIKNFLTNAAAETLLAINASDEILHPKPPKTDSEKAEEIAIRLEPSMKRIFPKSRAVLTPLYDLLEGNKWFSNISIKNSVDMRYRTLNIGCADEATDLCLNKFGKCKQISTRHATIFYDEYSRQFELLNYSEYGTEINGQLYSCNIVNCDHRYAMTLSNKVNKEEVKQMRHKVREIVDKRRHYNNNHKNNNSNNKNNQETNSVQKMNSQPLVLPPSPTEKAMANNWISCPDNIRLQAPDKPDCQCNLRPPAVPGWEDTVLLQHGSLIRFGCIPFVFSITHYVRNDDEDFDDCCYN